MPHYEWTGGPNILEYPGGGGGGGSNYTPTVAL